MKYADETYVIIPAGNINFGSAELTNTSSWARDNNLEVNLGKSVEMVFVRPRSKGSQFEPPSVISGLRRVEWIKMLEVTISRKFSVSQHVDNLLAVCSQSLFALRTLRQHGLPNDALHQVFQEIVVNRLSYASPAWWGFTGIEVITFRLPLKSYRDHLQAVLLKFLTCVLRSTEPPTLCGVKNEQLPTSCG